MTSNNGFIKLHRDICNCDWFSDNKTLAVYIRLVFAAAWRDTRCNGVDLKRGQVITTIAKLAQQSQQTVQQTRTALSRLKTTGWVTIKGTPKYSIITLNFYDFAFENNKLNGKETTSQQQTECQQNNIPSLLKKNIRSEEEEEATPSRSELNSVFGEVVNAFNENCKSLAPITGEPTYSQCHLIIEAQKRLNGVTFAEFFQRVERSAFLTGKSSSNFKADFNWILKPENMMKILSGNYDQVYGQPQTISKAPTAADYHVSLWD